MGMSFMRKITDPEKFPEGSEKGSIKERSTSSITRNFNNVDSTLLLKIVLDPFLKFCKFIGIFPLQVCNKSGSATAGIREWASLFYYLFVGLFIGLSVVYDGIYIEVMGRVEGDSIFEVSRYLFVSGQYVATCFTILIVPRLCRRTASLWNKLLVILPPLYQNHTGSRKTFVAAYVKSRLAIICWLLIVSSSWYLWWLSFNAYFQKKFHDDEKTLYYLNVGGALSLATLISCHVLPSMLFVLWLAVFRAAYKSIILQGRIISTPESECDPTEDLARLGQLIDIFARLNVLVRRLGEIYGRYLIVEMCAFFTALLTNIFSIMTGFKEVGSIQWETASVSIAVNIIWFYVICEAGEGLQKEQMRCLKALKTWTICHKGPGSWMISTLLDDNAVGVTAANYFPVSRQLATQVTGAIVMYLIVMLQFRANTRPQIDLTDPNCQ